MRPVDAPTPPIPDQDDASDTPLAATTEEQIEDELDEWLEIILTDDDDPPKPMAGAKYRVELDNGTILEGYLDAEGKAKFEGIRKGEAKVTFPELMPCTT